MGAPKYPLVSVCAWCPESEELRTRLAAGGFRVTDGMCAKCHAGVQRDLGATPSISPLCPHCESALVVRITLPVVLECETCNYALTVDVDRGTVAATTAAVAGA